MDRGSIMSWLKPSHQKDVDCQDCTFHVEKVRIVVTDISTGEQKGEDTADHYCVKRFITVLSSGLFLGCSEGEEKQKEGK